MSDNGCCVRALAFQILNRFYDLLHQDLLILLFILLVHCFSQVPGKESPGQ